MEPRSGTGSSLTPAAPLFFPTRRAGIVLLLSTPEKEGEPEQDPATGSVDPFPLVVGEAGAKSRVLVITSYSIHYTKLYDVVA